MQPLFQASGWALPSTIVTESNKKKNKANANTEDVSTKKISKEADLLQAEFNKLKPHEKKNKGKKQNKRSRQEEQDEEEKGTKNGNNSSKNKNNVSKKQKLNQDQQGNNNKNKQNKPAERQQQQKVQKQEPAKKDNQKQQPEKQQPQNQQEQQQQKKKNKNKKNKQASDNNQVNHVTPPSPTATDNTPKNSQPKDKALESSENDKKKNTLDVNKKSKLKALLEKQKKIPSNDQPQPKDKIKKQQNSNSNNNKETTKAINITTPEKGLTPLQQKMKDKLSGARFRWLNEKLYTTEGNEAYTLFQDQPELFDEYHEGFRHQVESWPENPVDVILDQLRETPEGTVVADLGCGDAIIGHTLTKQKVLSFDLIAKNDKVIACDITKLPLPANFVDIAVFSLSLMGTNYFDFLTEAHRILKPGGELKIAEVVSRFSDIDGFIDLVESIGFDFIEKDDGNKMFVMLYFTKKEDLLAMADEAEDEMLQGLTKKQKRQLQKGAGGKVNTTTLKKKSQKLLKPCLYKRR